LINSAGNRRNAPSINHTDYQKAVIVYVSLDGIDVGVGSGASSTGGG
jgi:hypothetical protein